MRVRTHILPSATRQRWAESAFQVSDTAGLEKNLDSGFDQECNVSRLSASGSEQKWKILLLSILLQQYVYLNRQLKSFKLFC